MITMIVVLAWLLCSLYSFGTVFAFFQDEFPTIAKDDRRVTYGFATYVALLGPIGALLALLFSGFNKYGWRLR